jgi:hypothetical protein
MSINIDKLSEQALRDLNRRIVERLKFLQQAKTQQSMMRFTKGSHVCFETEEGRVFGHIIKFNKKTVSVITDDHTQWNVSPRMLSLVKDVEHEGEGYFLITTEGKRGK